MELPLWLAEMLAVSNPSGNSSLATLDLPQALSQRVMNALKADPKTVDIRAQAQHFYNIGARMLELFEEEDMVDILTNVSSQPCFPTTDHNLMSRTNRRSSNVQQKFQTKRSTHEVHWAKVLNLQGGWMRQNDNVSVGAQPKANLPEVNLCVLQCSARLMIAAMQ